MQKYKVYRRDHESTRSAKRLVNAQCTAWDCLESEKSRLSIWSPRYAEIRIQQMQIICAYHQYKRIADGSISLHMEHAS